MFGYRRIVIFDTSCPSRRMTLLSVSTNHLFRNSTSVLGDGVLSSCDRVIVKTTVQKLFCILGSLFLGPNIIFRIVSFSVTGQNTNDSLLNILDKEKSRITLSIKQLEEDPLLETLDKVIPQEGQFVSDAGSMSSNLNMEPLPGLESICKELLQEDDVTDVRLGRQGLEKRVVSQDLELWLSNIPAKDKQFTLLARAGRQVQEVYLTTTLDLDGIKKAVQRVLGRVP
ncbi:uncharacterized protein A4U43_C10F12710 [Asparagus officinalis]|uniref:Uncharacterized protein n=1 Tax=Asparagus officinalis TaxID=4686 RepID=A0A5P1E2T8_ASPOF|nr:uncharacterized protein A4U43_C10F12710 [Asparagus officinalis]